MSDREEAIARAEAAIEQFLCEQTAPWHGRDLAERVVAAINGEPNERKPH